MKRKKKLTDEEREELRYHQCNPEESWWENDAQGIPLCRVCDECREVKLSGYRPEILSGYNQNDVDEPIEPDEWDEIQNRVHMWPRGIGTE